MTLFIPIKHLPASIHVHEEVQSWGGKITLHNYPNSKLNNCDSN